MVIIDVHLHLADILVRQVSHFQIKEYKASCQSIIKDQINIEVPAIQCDALLTSHKSETFPKFQEKLTQIIDKSLLDIFFKKALVLLDAGKLKYIGVLYQIGGVLYLVPFLCKSQDVLFIMRLGQSFEQQRVDLPLQLSGGPAGVDRFNLVKSASLRFFHPKE